MITPADYFNFLNTVLPLCFPILAIGLGIQVGWMVAKQVHRLFQDTYMPASQLGSLIDEWAEEEKRKNEEPDKPKRGEYPDYFGAEELWDELLEDKPKRAPRTVLTLGDDGELIEVIDDREGE